MDANLVINDVDSIHAGAVTQTQNGQYKLTVMILNTDGLIMDIDLLSYERHVLELFSLKQSGKNNEPV